MNGESGHHARNHVAAEFDHDAENVYLDAQILILIEDTRKDLVMNMNVVSEFANHFENFYLISRLEKVNLFTYVS